MIKAVRNCNSIQSLLQGILGNSSMSNLSCLPITSTQLPSNGTTIGLCENACRYKYKVYMS